MKVGIRKVRKPHHLKSTQTHITADNVFIGARKSCSEVIVSRQIVRRSGSGPLVVIASSKRKLPKKELLVSRNARTKNWMRNPELGDILTTAFAKAVKEAKRGAAKRPG
jgi:hypothetical protein